MDICVEGKGSCLVGRYTDTGKSEIPITRLFGLQSFLVCRYQLLRSLSLAHYSIPEAIYWYEKMAFYHPMFVQDTLSRVSSR